MTNKYESIPVVVDLDKILREWAKGYEKDGVEIINAEWYVDVQKNKVCFVLGTMKAEPK